MEYLCGGEAVISEKIRAAVNFTAAFHHYSFFLQKCFMRQIPRRSGSLPDQPMDSSTFAN